MFPRAGRDMLYSAASSTGDYCPQGATLCVPASLLRGTCAVQNSGGTVRDDPGRSERRGFNEPSGVFWCDGAC
jgi:hypothetical protein